MTQEEAAERLCALLNEIDAAGIKCSISPRSDRGVIQVGKTEVVEPFFDDWPWEVETDD